MKKSIPILALAQSTLVSCHYAFTNILHNDVAYEHWQFIRKWGAERFKVYGSDRHDDYTPFHHNYRDPFSDGTYVEYEERHLVVTKKEMRCNFNSTFASETLVVKAGDTLGYYVNDKPEFQDGDDRLFHTGPTFIYMGKVPEGKTAQNWEGDGKTWFKIYQDFPPPRPDPAAYNETDYSWRRWENNDKSKVSVRIPPNTPNGEYLFRIEHIQIDSAVGWYISCGQIRVENGGNGVPGPLVEIPGYYAADELMFSPDTLKHVFFNYSAGPQPWETKPPGPEVWIG